MLDAFENIIGQPQVRDFLRNAVRNDRLTHAYLFTGAAGSNKTLAAYALAQAVICPKETKSAKGGACGQCDACQRVRKRRHPDVHFYEPEGANGYLIEQIREIVNDVTLAPISASRKVYIIDRVDRLGVSAANAFLKTLEEPPDDVVLILLGRTVEAVLPTIVSRCQVVPFRHIPASEAVGIVRQNTGASSELCRVAIEACGGSITKAVEFLKAPGNERLQFRQSVLDTLASLIQADDWDIIGYGADLIRAAKLPLDQVRQQQVQEREENADFLVPSALQRLKKQHERQLTARSMNYMHQLTAIIRSWLRDVMMVCAQTPDLVINTDARAVIEKAASMTTLDAVLKGLTAVDHCETAISYNVSPETCLDVLLFEVKEVLDGKNCTSAPSQ